MVDAKETAALEAPGAGPGASPLRLVRIAIAFYGALLAVAIAWRLSQDGAWPWRAADAAPAWPLPLRIAAGLVFGLALLVASRIWTHRCAAGRALARELAALVAGVSTAQALALAALSGVAEEAFFRGALQPRVGWLAASALFGLAHFHPRRELRTWSLSAGIAGLGFGALFAASGDLLAPVLAHALLNAVNLRWLGSERSLRAAKRSSHRLSADRETARP